MSNLRPVYIGPNGGRLKDVKQRLVNVLGDLDLGLDGFKLFDVNKDGLVSHLEFHRALSHVASAEQRDLLFNWIDSNNSGYINSFEWRRFASTNFIEEDTEDLKSLSMSDAQKKLAKQRVTTELHIAARDGLADDVKQLINKGENVDAKGEFGGTPLFMACLYGRDNVVDVLIKSGANVNELNDVGETPLHAAAYNDKSRIVNLLVDGGADVNKVGGKLSLTPLHRAMFLNRDSTARALLSAGASLDLCDKHGKKPLQLAPKFLRKCLVKELELSCVYLDA